LDETAESLKSLDPNHLVTYDSEGFLGSSTPGTVKRLALRLSRLENPIVIDEVVILPLADLIQDNPFDGLATGCDWARNSAGRHIDFACFHLWPDNWLKVRCAS
jgi:hypothetical protein